MSATVGRPVGAGNHPSGTSVKLGVTATQGSCRSGQGGRWMRIRVPIDKTYPLAEAKAGHEHMRTNQHFGKILLIP